MHPLFRPRVPFYRLKHVSQTEANNLCKHRYGLSRETSGGHIPNEVEEMLVLVSLTIQVRLDEFGCTHWSAQNVDAIVDWPYTRDVRIKGVREDATIRYMS